jgi:hypothetical protein
MKKLLCILIIIFFVSSAFAEQPSTPEIGSIVTFGSYEQDNNPDNGPEPIEWIVLDVQDGKALLISKYGLDAKPYNEKYEDVTWETCTLRTWLNGDFIQGAFSTGERSAILTTAVDNSSSQGFSGWSTSGGNNTQDQIFLLSYAEANKYFNVTFTNSNNTNARMSPTAYAVRNGAYTSSDYKTADDTAAGWSWLRSPGSPQNGAASVDLDGTLSYHNVRNYNVCVRPAFWLNPQSDIF